MIEKIKTMSRNNEKAIDFYEKMEKLARDENCSPRDASMASIAFLSNTIAHCFLGTETGIDQILTQLRDMTYERKRELEAGGS